MQILRVRSYPQNLDNPDMELEITVDGDGVLNIKDVTEMNGA